MSIPANMRLLPLPAYSPELNPIEHLWDEIREKYFHNKYFTSIGLLENHLVAALRDLELDHKRVASICSWDWIIKAVSNGN